MTRSTSTSVGDKGYYDIKVIHVTDANYNELWSFTPEAPGKTAGMEECLSWLAENNKIRNLGFGRVLISTPSQPRYEPWSLVQIADYDNTFNNFLVVSYFFNSQRPFSIVDSVNGDYFTTQEINFSFRKKYSDMSWQKYMTGAQIYRYPKYTPSST